MGLVKTTRAYIVHADGKRMFRFTLDTTSPRALILLEGEPVPFSTANIGSDPAEIAKTLNVWVHGKGLGGGWRPGDEVDMRVEEDGRGRPREDEDAPQLRRNVNLSDALAERAREIGDGNVSLGIRRALEAYPIDAP